MSDDLFEVYALRGAKGSDRPREWMLLAWARDEEIGRTLFLQACARSISTIRFVSYNGDDRGDRTSPTFIDEPFGRTVLAERSRV